MKKKGAKKKKTAASKSKTKRQVGYKTYYKKKYGDPETGNPGPRAGLG
jgi:hypothetical protein